MKIRFYGKLENLLYQTITVCTDQSGVNSKYSGVLTKVNIDYITMVLTTGTSLPTTNNCPINFKKKFQQSPGNEVIIPGLIVEIPIDKIVSVLHYAL